MQQRGRQTRGVARSTPTLHGGNLPGMRSPPMSASNHSVERWSRCLASHSALTQSASTNQLTCTLCPGTPAPGRTEPVPPTPFCLVLIQAERKTTCRGRITARSSSQSLSRLAIFSRGISEIRIPNYIPARSTRSIPERAGSAPGCDSSSIQSPADTLSPEQERFPESGEGDAQVVQGIENVDCTLPSASRRVTIFPEASTGSLNPQNRSITVSVPGRVLTLTAPLCKVKLGKT